MSDFCEFVPDDPSCKTPGPDEPRPVDPAGPPGGGEESGVWDDEKEPMKKMDKMNGKMMAWEDVDEWLDLWLSQGSGF